MAGNIWGSAYPLLAMLSSVMTYAVIACLFAMIYKFLPAARLSWGDVWIGAAFAAAANSATLGHSAGLASAGAISPR